MKLWTLELERHMALPLDPDTADPKATPPSDNTPLPAIQATAKCKSCLILSTIFRWATNHLFDANYSARFR